jgi:hypothetical protein
VIVGRYVTMLLKFMDRAANSALLAALQPLADRAYVDKTRLRDQGPMGGDAGWPTPGTMHSPAWFDQYDRTTT